MVGKILEFFKKFAPAGEVSSSSVLAGPGPSPPPEEPKKDPGSRRWRITEYYLATQDDHSGERIVPIYAKDGQTVIELASVGFFASLCLEGSGITGDGKLVNVAGGWTRVDTVDYQPVLDFHRKFLSKRPFSYSGLQVEGDRVVRALTFYEVPHDKFGVGFGICNGIDMVPYRTVAADIGRGKKSDPDFKARGGVCPIGTRAFIKQFVGLSLPDGTTHDGYVTVNDTGGGIFGAHFDVFIGHDDYRKMVKLPREVDVSFEGIDDLPDPYELGLRDV